MILVVDFGSQTAHLISRRLEEIGVKVRIILPEEILFSIDKDKPQGIIFSGGPASVYLKNAPKIDKKIFQQHIPILGICYGQQLIAYLLGGKVKPGETKEYGPATLIINKPTPLFASVSQHSRIWMSHGDEVVSPPKGFVLLAQSESIKAAAIANEKDKIYGVQFHPEVEHTEHGLLILRNFVEKICQVKLRKKKIDIQEIIRSIKKKIGAKKAIAAVSGGLDSTLAAALVAEAIGNNLIPIHIDNGLMRQGTIVKLKKYFLGNLKIKPIILDKRKEFLQALKGKVNPEEKRKIIGELYIRIFEKEIKNYPEAQFLVQGTIYSDVIESQGSKLADKIKSHHNVAGLPADLKLSLIEPLRNFYTDQVKKIAKQMGIPRDIIEQQPHPGPGYAIRILGEVTKERLQIIQKADKIVMEEMKKAHLYQKVLHSFPVLTGAKSTAVKGDGRVFGEVVAVRAVVSKDRMTADWAKLPFALLQRISTRINNEIPQVSRVVYDITTKPPATMEWE